MSESFLKIESVSKSFGNTKALDNVSLDINKSELFSLLGSSGCGKSTLLRIIAGFEKPDSGKIYLDGEDITCLLYTSPSPRDRTRSRMPSSA